MATQFMNMDLPVVEVTTGPEWAEALNLALSEVVDAHNHTSGNGAPIPSSAMNINADLDFQQWAAINLESTQYTSQSAEPDGTHFTYFLSNDFYVVDGNGVSVRITENGAISAASFGGITGLVSPASASFATDTFTWLYDTDEYALMASGPLLLHRDGEVAPDRIKITPPANLAASYDLTLPGALPPSSTSYLNVTTGGVVSFNATALASSVDTASIQALAVTRAKQAAVGQQISSSSGSFSTSSATWTAITNLTVTLTTTGRPVFIGTRAANATGANFFSYSAAPTINERYANIRIRDTVSGTSYVAETITKLENDTITYMPTTILSALLSVAAGTYTFVVEGQCTTGTTPSLRADGVVLYAYEL